MIRDPWIRVHANLSKKPVVGRLAEALNLDRHKAVGLLVTLWGAVAQQGADGALGPLSDTQIETWAEWTGKRGAFAGWVRAAHLDEDGRVREWDEYQGTLESRRSKERLRMQNVRSTLRERAHDGSQNVRSTERERTAHRAQYVAQRSHSRARTKRNELLSSGANTGTREAPALEAPASLDRTRNESELAEINRVRVLRGEPPKTYREVFGG